MPKPILSLKFRVFGVLADVASLGNVESLLNRSVVSAARRAAPFPLSGTASSRRTPWNTAAWLSFIDRTFVFVRVIRGPNQ